MGKTVCMPTNGVVEPDFLEYLVRTFDRWQKLYTEKITLGTREIAKFQNVILGARLNARFGFEAVSNQSISDADGKEHYTLMLYKNREAIGNEEPLYSFDTEIYR